MNLPVIMVCVTGQLTCEKLIDGAVEIAKKEFGKAEIKVVHVAQNNKKLFGYEHEGCALEFLFNLSRAYNAQMTVLRNDNVLGALEEYAREISADVILIGTQTNYPNRLGIRLQERLESCEVRVLSTKKQSVGRKLIAAHSESPA